MKTPLRGVMAAVLCAGTFAAGTPPLRAQDAPPAAAPAPPTQTVPTSVLPEGPAALLEYSSEPVTYSLRDVLETTLQNNLDIQIQHFNPQISASLIDTQISVFSPVLNFVAREAENTQPGTSQLSGGLSVTDSTRYYAGTYTDFFTIGGRLDATVFTDRSKTNNTFSTVNPSYFSQVAFTYTQSLLRNFGVEVNKTQITIAQNNEKISRAEFRQTVMNSLSDAEKAYWLLVFTIMDQHAKEASLKLAQDFLDQTRIKVKVGTLPPIEITQALAQVADQEEGIIIGLSAIRAAEDNLRRLMNVPTNSPLWHQPILPADEPQVLDKVVDEKEAIKTAMDKRPDIEQAKLDLSNRDALVRFNKNQKLWRLDFIGRYGASGLTGTFLPVVLDPNDPDTPPGCVPIPGSIPPQCIYDPPDESISTSYTQIGNRDFDTWSAELQLGIPLGTRASKAAYVQSEFQRDQSRLTMQQLQQTVVVQVRNAVRQLEADLKRVKAAQVNTQLQLEKLSAEQKKYENGMSTAFQVLTFQTDLTTARRRENLAVVDYNTDLVDLDRVLGILLDTRNINLAD